MNPVQLFCWHFMAYPYLAKDFDEKQSSGWVTVPNRLWDDERSRGLYQEYIDQLVYADQLGFDGMNLNGLSTARLRIGQRLMVFLQEFRGTLR